MQIAPSLIPGAGNGVFSTRDVSKGDFIGVYYGQLVDDDDFIPKELEGYTYQMATGKTIVPDPSCVCQFINDAIWIEKCVDEIAQWSVYYRDLEMTTMGAIKKSTRNFIDVLDVPYTYENEDMGVIADYNLEWVEVKIKDKQRKVFLKAIREIQEGEELYVFYGWDYWRGLLHKKAKELVKTHSQ